MKWGQCVVTQERVTADHLRQAVCPCCSADLVAKCGNIAPIHWSHASVKDCDPWWEPEGEWHRSWKSLFPDDCQEVVIQPHRADVKYKDWVVELQSSPISDTVIQEREEFYGERMIWIIDGYKFCERVGITRLKDSETEPGRTHLLGWGRPRLSWKAANKPIFIDLPTGVFCLYGGGLNRWEGTWLCEDVMNDYGDLGRYINAESVNVRKRQFLIDKMPLFKEWWAIAEAFYNEVYLSTFERGFINSYLHKLMDEHMRVPTLRPNLHLIGRLAGLRYSDKQEVVVRNIARRILGT